MAKYRATVEKADRNLGFLVFKVSAAGGGIPDETAFYDFLLSRPANPFDGHRGTIMAGWWFPDEQCGRVAFRPKDTRVLKAVDTVKATPARPVKTATPDESPAMRRWRQGWQ